jgi:hypothetical protein
VNAKTDAETDARTDARGPSSRAALLVLGAAIAGLALARVIDWRSHAHPR